MGTPLGRGAAGAAGKVSASMPRRDTKEERERLELPQVRRELQRMSATPFSGRTPPKPVNALGERIQVTCHVSEAGEIVERWQLSETDVRWYRLEAFRERWVTVKVDSRTPVMS